MKPWEIVSEALLLVSKSARVGITTAELDKIGEDYILSQGGTPYNKGYHPQWAKEAYPATFCIQVNDEIAHGIPSERVLKDGDVVSFDVGVKKDGLCGDAALTIIVGSVANSRGNAERLLWNAKRTLYAGIQKVKAGVTVGEISAAMEDYCRFAGYVTNIRMCGHAIGEEMHMAPQIPAARLEGFGETVLTEGMMICLEPMVTQKDRLGFLDGNGWTVKTSDGRNSALFEHQLLITKDGCEILTTHLLPGEISTETDLKTIVL